MSRRSIPPAPISNDWRTWANELYEYLNQPDMSEVENVPQAMQLGHQFDGRTARALENGQMMYDPNLGLMVMSEGGVWEPAYTAPAVAQQNGVLVNYSVAKNGTVYTTTATTDYSAGASFAYYVPRRSDTHVRITMTYRQFYERLSGRDDTYAKVRPMLYNGTSYASADPTTYQMWRTTNTATTSNSGSNIGTVGDAQIWQQPGDGFRYTNASVSPNGHEVVLVRLFHSAGYTDNTSEIDNCVFTFEEFYFEDDEIDVDHQTPPDRDEQP